MAKSFQSGRSTNTESVYATQKKTKKKQKKQHTDGYDSCTILAPTRTIMPRKREVKIKNWGKGGNDLKTHSRGQVIPVRKIYQHRIRVCHPKKKKKKTTKKNIQTDTIVVRSLL